MIKKAIIAYKPFEDNRMLLNFCSRYVELINFCAATLATTIATIKVILHLPFKHSTGSYSYTTEAIIPYLHGDAHNGCF